MAGLKEERAVITRVSSLLAVFLVAFLAVSCGGQDLNEEAVNDDSDVAITQRQSLDNQDNLLGQKAVCGNGPQERSFTIEVFDNDLDLGMGFKTTTWTYGESMPGPALETCVGDTVTITLVNYTDVDHGLDTHAFKIDAVKYASDSFTSVVDTPGVFMYHCASGPTTDLHIKAGMAGAMIVYPRDYQYRSAKEMVVIQGALYGDPGEGGFIPRDTQRMMDNNPLTIMFNGELEHSPVQVSAGDLVRLYFVNTGPGDSAVHVIGTILDRFYVSGNPLNVTYGVQTESVPAGSGAILEFRVPSEGTFVFVDHDNLRHLSFGAAIPFVASSN